MSDSPVNDLPSAIFRNPIGMSRQDLVLMQRRKARLEMVSAATSFFTGLFFGMLYIAQSTLAESLGWGSAAALVAAGAWWLLRRARPAEITEPQLLDTAASGEFDSDEEEDGEGKTGWDPVGILLAVTVVPLFVLVGLVVTCILPLLILGGFIAFAGGTSDLPVWDAIVYVVLANVVVDLCVNTPLMKRWGIPED